MPQLEIKPCPGAGARHRANRFACKQFVARPHIKAVKASKNQIVAAAHFQYQDFARFMVRTGKQNLTVAGGYDIRTGDCLNCHTRGATTPHAVHAAGCFRSVHRLDDRTPPQATKSCNVCRRNRNNALSLRMGAKCRDLRKQGFEVGRPAGLGIEPGFKIALLRRSSFGLLGLYREKLIEFRAGIAKLFRHTHAIALPGDQFPALFPERPQLQ